ncbi:MAG TPA: hypothetical protein ENN98_04160 [Desulfurivibrio alkaliphilus]|uniref:Uncharacterized protein n=1 Tax=Desulfurivibrio alkaliphilus TaxID=427923 RepID=A0A7C2XVE8_9BACT|nr:hypothetical protein [Desulfurivibrio alkaliphilus]
MRPPQQQGGLDDVMAAELKQEIAGRYFGFRKLIEEDSQDYAQKVREHSFILEKRISFDLMRIYLLLRDESLIQEFMELVGLNERLFFDSYLLESPSLQARVFECQRFKGWTRKGRFVRYFFTCYENLGFHVKVFDGKVRELEKMQGAIAEEIKYFYKQNNISAIMAFLRTLGDQQATGAMQGGMEIGLAEGLDSKLQIRPPAPVEQLLPIIKPMPPLKTIKRPLKKLILTAYSRQIPQLLALFNENSTPCPERNL